MSSVSSVHQHGQELYPPTRLFHHTIQRQTGRAERISGVRAASSYLARQLPALLNEREYNMGRINKIFAAQWVSERQVSIGTKCNKLLVLDLDTKQIANIPKLKSSKNSTPADCPCGIHSIAINPSMSLLATGGENTNDLAVYRLPTFDPVAAGEGGHTDWIFDIEWLDDEFLVTGSRDSQLCLWRVRDQDDAYIDPDSPDAHLPNYSSVKPVIAKKCANAEKVRALAYMETRSEVAALSLNARLHVFDINTFQQSTSCRKLQYHKENVCLAADSNRSLYAIGSQSYVSFLDARTMKSTQHVISKQRGSGIRSVSFNEDIVTFGTGAGAVYFFDLRANNYLDLNCGHQCALSIGKGWLQHDETYEFFFMDTADRPNAVYTHCYDPSGTKLFTAGGPLPAGLWGNYAALWQ